MGLREKTDRTNLEKTLSSKISSANWPSREGDQQKTLARSPTIAMAFNTSHSLANLHRLFQTSGTSNSPCNSISGYSQAISTCKTLSISKSPHTFSSISNSDSNNSNSNNDDDDDNTSVLKDLLPEEIFSRYNVQKVVLVVARELTRSEKWISSSEWWRMMFELE